MHKNRQIQRRYNTLYYITFYKEKQAFFKNCTCAQISSQCFDENYLICCIFASIAERLDFSGKIHYNEVKRLCVKTVKFSFSERFWNMKNFFANLSHPTKITLITCSSFVVLTMLILIFLMLCPIQESSSANNVNDSLVVTVASTEETQITSETTVSAVSTKFERKTTDANRVTTETITTAKTYGTQAVYEDDDTYNNYGSYDDDTDNSYQPAVTTRAYYNNNTSNATKPRYTTPAATQPPATNAPVVTQAPAVTAAPSVPEETIPAPDDGFYD